MSELSSSVDQSKVSAPDQVLPIVGIVALTGVLIASYWNTLSRTIEYWDSPQYSHGWLIPVFAAVLIWLRYQPFKEVSSFERWAGVCLLLAGLGMRLLATYVALVIPDMVSFIPCVLGVVLMFGGFHTLRWAGPAICFLFFMYPVPDQVENMLLDPLQNVATTSSTFALQTMGFAAIQEGNTIIMPNGMLLGVIDQCSGLRMLTIFVALCVAVVMVLGRPWWENLIILASAVPIALTVNIARITVTGMLYVLTTKELADKVFHDAAGWVMMPMALGILYVELQILSHLFIEEPPADLPSVDVPSSEPVSSTTS